MTTVVRPDLSRRTALSKSAVVQFDLCQTKAWFSIHDRRPFVPNEKTSFGSAVDAAVEKVIEDVRDGRDIDEERSFAAAAEIVERDAAGVELSKVESAVRTFRANILPTFDWAEVALQAHLNTNVDGLGEVDGHPDIILASNAVWDVKTGKAKRTAETPELGLYGVLVEAVSGSRVPAVGYIYYDRDLVTPKWGVISAPFTDEYHRWAFERARAFARAKEADALLNAGAERAENYSMVGGPKFDGLCSDCPYSPALGGPCSLVYKKEEAS